MFGFKFKKFSIRCRAIILNDEGKLLVVKHVHDTSFAALPGGHLEWGEDIKEGLRREIVEELGVVPEIGRLLYVNNFMENKKKQSVEFFFEVLNSHEYKNIEDKNRTHAYEIAQVCWLESTSSIMVLPKQVGEDFKAGQLISNEVRCIPIYKFNRKN